MNTNLMWLLPLCVIVSICISLPAVWLISKAMGLTFNASWVATFSGAFSAAIVLAKNIEINQLNFLVCK